jgi:K+-sensing histidine kinase KdpD
LLEILNFSVKRLERFSLNALLITRLRTKQFDIRRENIHILKLINEVIVEAKEKLLSGNIEVIFVNKTFTGSVSGETELIKSCLGNILDNAIFQSPKNSIIEISLYEQDRSPVCEFKDNGRGFTKEALDNIFELFNTGNEHRDNGSGLGLSLAKMIMEAHGGGIAIANNQAGGASVKLLFQDIIDSSVTYMPEIQL